jgi:hypothetical protein
MKNGNNCFTCCLRCVLVSFFFITLQAHSSNVSCNGTPSPAAYCSLLSKGSIAVLTKHNPSYIEFYCFNGVKNIGSSSCRGLSLSDSPQVKKSKIPNVDFSNRARLLDKFIKNHD